MSKAKPDPFGRILCWFGRHRWTPWGSAGGDGGLDTMVFKCARCAAPGMLREEFKEHVGSA